MSTKRTKTVHGVKMAYLKEGHGDPIVLLHGNPTSSYLWRKVIPPLAERGQCIAPDLIGMGDSAKLPDSGPDRYRLVEHRYYLDALLLEMGIESNITFVIHDWGSALGFDWAYRHPAAIKGIAYMEALVGPLSWSEWPAQARSIFEGFRSEAGEALVLEKNYFVERVLPASVLKPLPSEVMDEYRRPFLEPGEPRRPTLTWPREIPLDGQPADVHGIVARYHGWLGAASVPKLYVHAEPGFFSPTIAEVVEKWPSQEKVTVEGHHFLQEDSGEAIGLAIADWYDNL